MDRTVAPNSSGGLYVDKTPTTPGTLIIEDDKNVTQEELVNVVLQSSQTLSLADDEQVSRGSQILAAVSDFYLESGVANVYQIDAISPRLDPIAYIEGQRARFFPTNTNTGSSTLQLAALGAIPIKLRDGSTDPFPGEIEVNRQVTGFFTSAFGPLQFIYDNSPDILRVKAFGNFNGVAGVSIRKSYNVSGISRTAPGRYTTTFTNAFATGDYSAVVSGGGATSGGDNFANLGSTDFLGASFDIRTLDDNGTDEDSSNITFIVV